MNMNRHGREDITMIDEDGGGLIVSLQYIYILLSFYSALQKIIKNYIDRNTCYII